MLEKINLIESALSKIQEISEKYQSLKVQDKLSKSIIRSLEHENASLRGENDLLRNILYEYKSAQLVRKAGDGLQKIAGKSTARMGLFTTTKVKSPQPIVDITTSFNNL